MTRIKTDAEPTVKELETLSLRKAFGPFEDIHPQSYFYIHLAGRNPTMLAWRENLLPSATNRNAETDRNGGNLLPDLIELIDADDASILAFASRHGPLGVWPVVIDHAEEGEPERQSHSPGEEETTGLLLESTDLYRSFARRCRLILWVCGKLQAGETIPNGEWKQLLDPNTARHYIPDEDVPAFLRPSTRPPDKEEAWNLLANALRAWELQVPMFFLTFRRHPSDHSLSSRYWIGPSLKTLWDPPKVAKLEDAEELCAQVAARDLRTASTYSDYPFRLSETFARILQQIMTWVTSPIYLCAVCGKPMAATGRRPRTDRAVLCSSTCEREQGRLRMQQRRAQQKQQEAQSREDTPPPRKSRSAQ